MRKIDFTYELPQELIAQKPLKNRSDSRLLCLNRANGEVRHKHFSDFLDYLRPNDCLVINDTRVIPARLLGVRTDTRRPCEVLLLRREQDDIWDCIVRPGKKLKAGQRLTFIQNRLTAEICEVKPDGNRRIRFDYKGIWEEILDEAGTMPLPPYIHEALHHEDKERYQTVYATVDGSAAAPTAGLHFTPQILYAIKKKGVAIASLTLHVGLGTFRPVKTDDIKDHQMHAEWYALSDEASRTIQAAKDAGGRIVAVGTTSCRTLETIASQDPMLRPRSGMTDIFIYPGYTFRAIDALLTNFHLPESTLIMLVSAFAGKEKVFFAYHEAIKEKYRFYSFGDAMFIYDET